jgi:hypothetical protein
MAWGVLTWRLAPRVRQEPYCPFRAISCRTPRYISGKTGLPAPPSQPQSPFLPDARHINGKKLSGSVVGAAGQATFIHCFPGVWRFGVTKNGLEGRLSHLRAEVCQASAAATVKRCPEVSPGRPLGVIALRDVNSRDGKEMPRGAGWTISARFLSTSNREALETTVWVFFPRDQRRLWSVHDRPVLPCWPRGNHASPRRLHS